MVAVGQLNLAVLASVIWRAGARVRSLARVRALAIVLARLVVRAEVEILIAEETTPALFAHALEWLLARTVQTSRISNTFGAQMTLVAEATFTFKRLLAETMLVRAAR